MEIIYNNNNNNSFRECFGITLSDNNEKLDKLEFIERWDKEFGDIKNCNESFISCDLSINKMNNGSYLVNGNVILCDECNEYDRNVEFIVNKEENTFYDLLERGLE
jgi:hypothetical protein